jgi:hypothetical protein
MGWINSAFNVETKLSARALSPAEPTTLPIEGTTPASSNLLPKAQRGVLYSLVGMVNEARSRLPTPQPHLQCLHHQLRPQVRGHQPAYNPPGVSVQDEGQMQETLPGFYVGDVGYPEPVR